MTGLWRPSHPFFNRYRTFVGSGLNEVFERARTFCLGAGHLVCDLRQLKVKDEFVYVYEGMLITCYDVITLGCVYLTVM